MADDALVGLGRRSALGLAGAGISGVATIATLVIANRALDGVETGQFFVALSVFAIAQGLCSLGIDAGLQYWVPAVDTASAKALVRHSFRTVTAISAAVAVLVWIAAEPFADLLSEGDVNDSTAVVRATAIMLPFAGLVEVAFGALRAADRVLSATVLDRIVRPVGQVIAMAAIGAVGGGAIAMVFGWMIPVVGSVLIAIWLVWRGDRHPRATNARPPIEPGAFWRYTGPRTVARAAQVLTQRLDVILLAAIGSLEDAAVYGTVSRCMIAGVFVATAVQQIVQPRLRKLVIHNDFAAVKSMYGASTTWLVIATWPAYLGMAIFAPTVLSAFGSDSDRGARALTILCLAMLVASACGLVEVVLLIVGRSWLSTINVIVALVANIVLNAVLIPPFGMTGAAIAWTVSIFCTNLLPLWQIWRIGLHPGGAALYTAMATGAIAFGVPLLIGRLVGGDGVVSLGVSLVVGIVAYLGALVVVRRHVLLDQFFNDLKPRQVNGRRRDHSIM